MFSVSKIGYTMFCEYFTSNTPICWIEDHKKPLNCRRTVLVFYSMFQIVSQIFKRLRSADLSDISRCAVMKDVWVFLKPKMYVCRHVNMAHVNLENTDVHNTLMKMVSKRWLLFTENVETCRLFHGDNHLNHWFQDVAKKTIKSCHNEL